MYVILVYDISLKEKTGQKILRKVFNTCKQYLNHIQNSVFEGELTEGTFTALKYDIDEIIRRDKDSVIYFSSRSGEWVTKEISGLNLNDLSNVL